MHQFPRTLTGKTIIVSILCTAFVAGCATVGDPMSILDEVEQNGAQDQGSDEHQALGQLLKKHGYDGVGMRYESGGTLNMLHRVFTDQRTHRRRIKLVYTGLHMNYDRKHESLTVGGTGDPREIIIFIAENVPVKK